MMRIILILICMLMTNFLQAQVYRSVDAEGNVIFTDEPSDGSVKVEIKELESIQSLGSPPVSSRPKIQKRQEEYSSIEITSPSNDISIRDNIGNVSISVSVSPRLRSGHKLVLYVDGAQYSSGQSMTFQLKNVDRGSHQIRAVVVDTNGRQQISSKTVTFHLQRHSVH